MIAYLDEDDVVRVALGDQARFYTDAMKGPVLRLEVTGIDRDASRTLPEAELTSLHGGALMVREKKGALVPDRALYRVTLTSSVPAPALARQSWRGNAVIAGRASVPAWRYVRAAMALFWREAGM